MHGLTKYSNSYLAFGHDPDLSRNMGEASSEVRRAMDVLKQIVATKALRATGTYEGKKFWPAWAIEHQNQMRLYRDYGPEKYAIQGEAWLAKQGNEDV